ncbi:MAG: hypothetical protein A2V70_15455 [Planctomycetes bacterium RBG_13_63_9]|nr:MAG: hypothetical protein A2V70_15455 [Planctomycetes bacterium RBG_13_63_9]
MARRFVFITPSPPFRVFVEHLAKDKDFLSDADAILQIDDHTLDRLADALAQNTSFLNRTALSEAVEQVIGAGENSRNIARTVWRVNRILRDADEPLDSAVAVLKRAINELCDKLSEDNRKRLGDRLERLAAAPAAFSRQHKAEKLAEATGAELEDLQIICDIRPVFNDDRSVIEGAIPLSTLRLDIVHVDETSRSIEIRLTEQQLTDLSAKVESAKRKISAIKTTLEAKSITLPLTSATTE